MDQGLRPTGMPGADVPGDSAIISGDPMIRILQDMIAQRASVLHQTAGAPATLQQPSALPPMPQQPPQQPPPLPVLPHQQLPGLTGSQPLQSQLQLLLQHAALQPAAPVSTFTAPQLQLQSGNIPTLQTIPPILPTGPVLQEQQQVPVVAAPAAKLQNSWIQGLLGRSLQSLSPFPHLSSSGSSGSSQTVQPATSYLYQGVPRGPIATDDSDLGDLRVVGAKGRRTDDAQRKRREREASDRKWAQLDDMFPATHSARSGNRAKALRSGRTREEVLERAVREVQAIQARDTDIREGLQHAGGIALLGVMMPSCQLVHTPDAFKHLCSWLSPELIEGHLLPTLLHPEDADAFRQLAAEVADEVSRSRRAKPEGEDGNGKRGSAEGRLLQRSIKVRVLRRPTARNTPEWILSYSEPITCTLMRIEQTGTGDDCVGIFFCDLSVPDPKGCEVCAAHVCNLIDAEIMHRGYEVSWDPEGMDVLELVAASGGWWQQQSDSKGGSGAWSWVQGLKRAVRCGASWFLRKAMSYSVKGVIVLSQEGSKMEIRVENTFRFVGGGSWRFQETATVGSPECMIPPPPAECGSGSVESKPPDGLTSQLIFVVADPSLDTAIHFVCLYFPQSLSTEGQPHAQRPERSERRMAEIRVDVVLRPQLLEIMSKMPWSTGKMSDRFVAVGKVIGNEKMSGKDSMAGHETTAAKDAASKALSAEIGQDAVTGQYGRGKYEWVSHTK